MSHTLQTSTDPIQSGEIYGFKWRCYNLMGYSDWSETFYAAAAEKPAAPNVPRIVYEWSSKSTIFVEWDRVSDGVAGPGSLIKGYRLLMDDGLGGPFKVLYDTTPFSPQILNYLASDLTNYLNYRFKVIAVNFNGEGPESPIAFLKPCSLPARFAKPFWISNTKV